MAEEQTDKSEQDQSQDSPEQPDKEQTGEQTGANASESTEEPDGKPKQGDQAEQDDDESEADAGQPVNENAESGGGGEEESDDADSKEDEKPEPEPLTPERLKAENSRNDLFIAGGALIVAVLLGCFKVADPAIWIHLKSGWAIASAGVAQPDSLSYTTSERSWVNPSWLFDRLVFQAERVETQFYADKVASVFDDEIAAAENPPILPDADAEAAAEIPAETIATMKQRVADLRAAATTVDTHTARHAAARLWSEASAAGMTVEHPPEQEALIGLVVPVLLKMILLGILAAVLLTIRHSGPTLWWTAVVFALAIAGASERVDLEPHVFSLLFVGISLCCLHQYFNFSKTWALFILIPYQLVWVNIDSYFVLGIAIPLLFLIGELIAGGKEARAKVPMLAVVVAILIGCSFANPYLHRVWSVPLEWTTNLCTGAGADLVRLEPVLRSPLSASFWSSDLLAQLLDRPALLIGFVLTVLAIGSFSINSQRFSLSRLLLLLVGFGMFMVSAINLAMLCLFAGFVLALNGQEWYLDKFGSEPRITKGWYLWSNAGRAVTILALTALAVSGPFRWIWADPARSLGLGVEWVRAGLQSAEYLRNIPVKGNCLQVTTAQGNLIAWANGPESKVYIDSRLLLHAPEVESYQQVMSSLRDLDEEKLLEFFDRYDITHVVLNLNAWSGHPVFYQTPASLGDSDDFILLHLDGANAIYGRLDLPEDHKLASDSAWFKENGFNAAELAFKKKSDIPPEPPALVSPPSWIDTLAGSRTLPNASSLEANLLMDARVVPFERLQVTPTRPVLAPPVENCLLAIRAARKALSGTRVIPKAYAVLADAYYYLLAHEQHQLNLTFGDNPPSVSVVNELRQVQVLTAFNQLITADPDFGNGHGQFTLARRYIDQNYIDLAAKHLSESLMKVPPEESLGFAQVVDEFQLRVDRVRAELDALMLNMPNPLEQRDYLLRQGCPNIAIEILSQHYNSDISAGGKLLAPMLAQLYISTGQLGDLDKEGASKIVQNMDTTATQTPGEFEELWAVVSVMEGNYQESRKSLEGAIAKTRHSMLRNSLGSFRADPMGAQVGLFQGNPLVQASHWYEVGVEVDRWARLEFYLGLIQLEAGEPGEAARHFEQSLKLRDDMAFQPIIAFYLEKITNKKIPRLEIEPPEDPEADASGETGKPGEAGDAEPGEPSDSTSKPANSEDEGEPAANPDKTKQSAETTSNQ